MVRARQNLEQFIAQLHSMAFFKEFTFSKNKFSPDPKEELELADNLIWIGDFLAVLQLKERNQAYVKDETSERKWFKKRVIGTATKQIRDTLRYLDEHKEIQITNERDHTFNIASALFDDVLKLVVYLPGSILPKRCRQTKHHVSQTAGFIHIVNARDYLEICRTLRVPADIQDYFSYRQQVIENFGEAITNIPEPLFMGQYLSGNTQEAPSPDSYPYLQELIQDADAFDISGLIGNLHNHIERAKDPYSYYRIIQEFAKLPRSMWREIKTRFMLCLEKTKNNEFTLPYRIAYPATGCAFVLIPVDPKIVANPDWPKLRLTGLQMFAHAQKYDQKLDKCIGISVAMEDEDYLIDWCLLDFPWEHDPEMEKKLADNFPFRKVRKVEAKRFKFL